MQKLGVLAYVIVTNTFRPLVMAQAKARGVEPRLLVVKHPVGGLNNAELGARIDEASQALLAAVTAGSPA